MLSKCHILPTEEKVESQVLWNLYLRLYTASSVIGTMIPSVCFCYDKKA